MVLEVVVETVEDALAACRGGADQVEVKCDYLEYGLTPSLGMLEEIVRQVDCDVLCMIRPHARSLVLSRHDLEAMKRDILYAKQLPIKGYLLGCLTEEGELDVPALEELKITAAPLEVHFHLGWEQTINPQKSLETLIGLGFASARTSGGDGISGNVLENTERIREYSRIIQDRLDIFLAGGVRLESLPELLEVTGLWNVHTGSGVREPECRTGKVVEEKVAQMKKVLSG